MPDELYKWAKAFLLAKSAFNRAYCVYWQREVRPCSDKTGWKLLEAFRHAVEEYRFKLNRREQGIKQAAWQIFRQELVGEADYDSHDIVGFVKWYCALTGKISQAIKHLYDFHGDSFGDLVDCFPLAGRELVERALASHPTIGRPRSDGYLAEKEIGNDLLEKLGAPWHHLIFKGENYVLGALEGACHNYFLRRILTGRDERIVWTEEEKYAINFVGHYDD
jgi:hypothetical protein